MVVQSTLLSAQTMLSVVGRVVDADSGQPLEGVSVVVGKSGTVTDSYGSFKLSFPSSESLLGIFLCSAFVANTPHARGGQNATTRR